MKSETNILIFFYTIFLNVLFCIYYPVHAQHPLGYCADAICSEPLSLGKTVQRYMAPSVGMLSLQPGVDVKIYVAQYGAESNLLGIEINGKRGYVPKTMIMETRSLKSPTFPLQTDFLSLPSSLNQASSQFISTTLQPSSSVPHISEVVVTPQSATDQLQSLSPDTAGVENSPRSLFPSPPVSNDFNPNNPSVSQLGEQSVYQSASVFPNPGVRRSEINEFGTASVISISHSYSLDLSSPENVFHLSTSLANTANLGSINYDSANSLEHSHSPKMASDYGASNMFTPENINSVISSSHLESNFLSQPPPVSGQSFSSGENLHSGNFHPDPRSATKFEERNNVGVSSSIHQSIGASDQIFTIDASMDSSSNFLSRMQDHEHTLSRLSELGYTDYKLPDSPQSTSNSNSKSSNDVPKETDISIDHTEATRNAVEFSSSVIPEATSKYVDLNKKTMESESVRENSNHLKTEPPVSDGREIEGITENKNDEKEGEDDEMKEDSEEGEDDEMKEDSEEGEDDEMKQDSEENDDSFNTGTKSEEKDLSSVAPNEISTVDVPSQEETQSSNEDSPTYESFTSENDNEDAASVGTGEHPVVDDSKEHSIDPTTSSFIGQIISNSIDNIMNSFTLFSETSQKSALNHVTESSMLDDTDNFEHSTIEKDYASKPTMRSILEKNENPNISDIGSKTDELNDDEVFPQEEESAYSKQISEESVILTTAYETLSNFMTALRSFLDQLISFLPEPVYSYLMNLNASRISTRAVVFTSLMTVPCLFLFLAALFLKESSKEQVVIAKLTDTEHQLYLASTERNLLHEDVASLKEQIVELEQSLEVERNVASTLQIELQGYEQVNLSANIEQKENLSLIQNLKKQIKEYGKTSFDLETLLNEERERCEEVLSQLRGEEEAVDNLRIENENMKEDIEKLQSEKFALATDVDSYKEQLSQFELYCKEIRQEADSYNVKVVELTDQTSTCLSMIEELERNILSKDDEIGALRSAISNMEVLQKMKGSGDADDKTIEDKLTALLDISSLQNKLVKVEKEKESFLDKLKEKTKDCDEMKVDLLELKSKIENLKMHKERAVEDKNRAQSELNVLEKYFKEKEVQLQMELGTQLTVRQQKEMDVSQAQRHIFQLEEENVSYKSQLATLKLEIEETERNLKKQIAAQEESAHKNWVAARTAERKAVESKQEVAQFRQRVTLLERERETWSNSLQSDIIKPVPQRISVSDHDVSQGSNISGEFKPEFMISRHLPPMMHPIMPPPPLPAHGPPPLMPPSFMPPFNPMVPPPPRRPPPWHMMQDKNLDYDRRNTPSDFESSVSSRRPHTPPEFESSSSSRRHHTPPEFESSRRHHTPPEFESSRRHHTPPEFESSRRHHTPPDFESYGSSRMHHTPPYYGRELERRSSPVEGSSHSRSSSPLPDFHNVPPPVSRHRDDPPMHPRYPGPHPLSGMPKRDVEYVPSRSSKTEDRGNNNYRGESQTSSRERDY